MLGGARLQTADGETVSISGKKSLALIAYLCQCQGMAASRDKLSDLLWSSADNWHARNSLRQTLAMLRRELSPYDPDILFSRHDLVGLRPLSVNCDVHRFLSAAATGSMDDGHTLADIYTGPFLDGFFAGSDIFEDWASAERGRLAGVAIIALERLAREASGKHGLDFARRLLTIEPTGESSHRLMMEMLARNGHRDLALRQYDLCRDMLGREFGVQPSPETERLRQTIVTPQPARDWKAPAFADRTQQSMEQRPSVGVQLFVNLTGSQGEELVSRGLAQAIVTELSPHKELIIRADEVPSDFRADSPRIAEIASRLGVRYILGGSVQRTNEHLRVNAHLVDASAGDHIWAERYDGAVEEALDFQDKVAQSMAFATRVHLLRARWKVRDKAPLDDPAARLLVNRAVVKYYEMTRASLSASVALAERALEIDPDSAQAMRTLSFATTVAMALGAFAKTPETLKRAISLAETAVAAVPDDEIARCALSFALLSADRHNEAAAQVRYALILNPHYPNARGDLAEICAFLGQTNEAIEEATEAIRSSFHDPADFWRHYALSVAKFAACDDAGALESARHVMRSKPDFARGALFWAAAAAASGNFEEARRAVELCLGQLPDLRLGNVSPGFVPRYVREQQQKRFLDMLGKAGLPR
ncbi:DNA-binding SARP family transcriptional activator [Aminobacter sp. AP02]|nr:DNA-binding SARP family transcriptional activator [Aminobacter sp. AP02]